MSPSRSAQRRTARERVAEQRAAQARAERRRRLTWSITTIVVVLAVIGVLVAVATTGGKSKSTAGDSSPAPAAVVNTITTVPDSAFAKATANVTKPKPISGGTLDTKNGKPYVLYIGADYCPYCAVTRWPLTIALSRFGKFSDLRVTKSSSTDVFPNTPTLSFHGSTYTSDYLDFVPVETQTRTGKTLQSLTADQQAIEKKFNTSGGIPFVYIAGKYTMGTAFTPQLISGKDWTAVAKAAVDPSTQFGNAALASANDLTAAFCQLTGGKPGAVCDSAPVKAAQSALAKQG